MTTTIICADALVWMAGTHTRGPVATSLPDAEEIGISLVEWAEWFIRAATACMRIARDGDRVLFYQTDRKAGGKTLSKPELLFRAATDAGSSLLWHKIALRRGAGSIDLHRPGYTHLMAFGRNARPGTATPDVFEAGKPVYKNGVGSIAARIMVDFAGVDDAPIIDPFCGRGTILRAAADSGYDAVGVDIDPMQCAAAEDYCNPNLAANAASASLVSASGSRPN